jgi:DNA-binding transcriptional regulator YhcF (GntR family)
MLETHKKAFAELKKEYWTAENKKLVLSKKKDLEKFFTLAKAELVEAGEVLKKHGVNTDAIGSKIESIYEEKKGLIEKLGKTPTAKAAKKKLSTLVAKIKKSI